MLYKKVVVFFSIFICENYEDNVWIWSAISYVYYLISSCSIKVHLLIRGCEWWGINYISLVLKYGTLKGSLIHWYLFHLWTNLLLLMRSYLKLTDLAVQLTCLVMLNKSLIRPGLVVCELVKQRKFASLERKDCFKVEIAFLPPWSQMFRNTWELHL